MDRGIKLLAILIMCAVGVGVLFTMLYKHDSARLLQIYATRSSSVIDTSNIRIRQWRHFYTTEAHIDSIRREFYYDKIHNMFCNAGFSDSLASVYAEIPSVESNWQTTVRSRAGATGLWQIMPATAGEYGATYEDLKDPIISTRIAIAIIKDLDSLNNHDVAKILFSYNGGLGVVSGHLEKFKTDDIWMVNFANRETYDYAPKVLGAYLAMMK